MVNLVFSINKNYIFHCKVVLNSIFLNTNHHTFNVSILSNDYEVKQAKLDYENFFYTAFPEKKITFHVYEVPEAQILELPILSHPFSKEVYYRLLIPNILPNNIEKVIFLDSDIVVERDIKELYNVDLANTSIGAVSNLKGESFRELGLRDEYDYFNAGVLLMNLKRMRELNEVEGLINYGLEHYRKIKLADQDILNGFYKDNYKKLPLIWNWQNHFYELENEIPKFNELVKQKRIAHFSYETKPWHFVNFQVDKELYIKYAKDFKEFDELYKEKEKLKKYNLLIWGTGSVALKLLPILENINAQCIGFIDSNVKNTNKKFLNKYTIKSPETALQQLKKNDLIIIASSFYKEIMEKYPEYKDIMIPYSKIHEL